MVNRLGEDELWLSERTWGCRINSLEDSVLENIQAIVAVLTLLLLRETTESLIKLCVVEAVFPQKQKIHL